MRRVVTSATKGTQPGYLQYDNLDDRREAFRLLARLSPQERVRWVQGVYAQARLLPYPTLAPKMARSTLELAERARTDSGADEELTLTLWIDVWACADAFEGINLARSLKELERRARLA